MIKPVLQDESFLADVREVQHELEQLKIWWLGQSGFLVQWHGRHLLFDPYLSDSLTMKYAGTDKPHVRITERVVAPEKLDFIDVVTSSHNHTDHLDKETLAPLLQANQQIELVIPEANREFVVNRLGLVSEFPKGLNAGESINVKQFEISAVPAAHNELEQDSWGRHRYLGYVVKMGQWTIYHAGDTKHYEGMEDFLRPFNVDVALLPINGDRPERKVAGNLDGREAALLARDIGAMVVIPCHYDMFEFNTVSPNEFVMAAREIGQKHRILRCGERWTSAELQSMRQPHE